MEREKRERGPLSLLRLVRLTEPEPEDNIWDCKKGEIKCDDGPFLVLAGAGES